MPANVILATGTMLVERYRIVKMLGRGGFGAVYKAWDTRLNSPCAVKENFDTNTESERQFAREASLLAGMRHPHLPVMIDHFIIPGQGQYLVMDFVAGDDLLSILEKTGQPLDEAQVLPWFIQVCDALNYLHSRKQPVIHRDLKPANIRITPDGDAMLVDFGIAKTFDPSSKTTMGARAVTPGYSPPEQYGFGSTDARSDIYALGASLYTLLTAKLPVESVQRTVGVALPPPRSLNPRISPATEAIILKAMALLPANRFQTGAEFKAALSRAQTHPMVDQGLSSTVTLHSATAPPAAQPAMAIPQAAPLPQRKAASKRLLPWLVLGGLVGIVGIGLAIGLLAQNQAAPASPTVVALTGATNTPAPTRAPGLSHTPTETALITPLSPIPTPAPPLATETPMPTAMPELPVLAATALPVGLQSITAANAASLELVARWGRGTIEEIVWSPDGEMVAIAGSIGVHLYDAQTFETLAYFETGVWAYAVAFSPDGTLLAAGLEDATIRLWRIADQTPLQTLEGHSGAVWSVAFSPDGSLLASGSADSDINLWSLPDGSFVRQLTGHLYGVYTVDFSPDGQLVASGGGDNTVRLWNTADGTQISGQMGHARRVYSVAFSPDGTILASGSQDDTLRLWDVADGVVIETLSGHTDDVNAVAFSPDGSLLASASSDGTARLWQVADAALVRQTENRTDAVASVAFSPDGNTIAVGAIDGTFQTWQAADGASEQIFDGLADVVRCLDYSPDGTRLAAGYSDGKIRLWDTTNGNVLRVLTGHTGSVSSVAFSPDGSVLASGSADTTIRLWRVSDGALLRMIEGHSQEVTSVAFSPDGTRLASASRDGWLRLWQASDGAPIDALGGGS